MELTSYSLKTPSHQNEWQAYHAIRRKVLFENRGHFGVYDEHHPDESRDGAHPLVLLYRGEPIGTIRVDIDGDLAIFRRVAIRDDLQRQGHGRVMLSLAEAFVRGRECKSARSFVDPTAVGFYERCGFSRDHASSSDLTHTPMMKEFA